MTKRLYILRHAKATQASDDADDHARPLDEKGRTEAKTLGRWLAAQPLKPQAVLCSTAERTRETHALLNLDAPVAFNDTLYLASANELLNLLHRLEPTLERLLLVTHNAGAHELAAALSGTATDANFEKLRDGFPTCALAIISFDGDWKNLKPGKGKLEALVYSSDL